MVFSDTVYYDRSDSKKDNLILVQIPRHHNKLITLYLPNRTKIIRFCAIETIISSMKTGKVKKLILKLSAKVAFIIYQNPKYLKRELYLTTWWS